MTLPSSGSLSYNTIRAEFGSPSTNVYLSLYYRGGPYTYPVPANASITTSSTGTISVANFYGADNTTDYAKVNGQTYNSGGKNPIIYYGTGMPNTGGGNIPDTSLKVGSLSTNFSPPGSLDCYATNNSNLTMTFSTNTFGNSNFTLRNFYFYNTSGTLVGTFRTGAQAGKNPGGQPTQYQAPNQSGVYSQALDNGLAGPAGSGSNVSGPSAAWQTGSAAGALASTFFLKAF